MAVIFHVVLNASAVNIQNYVVLESVWMLTLFVFVYSFSVNCSVVFYCREN